MGWRWGGGCDRPDTRPGGAQLHSHGSIPVTRAAGLSPPGPPLKINLKVSPLRERGESLCPPRKDQPIRVSMPAPPRTDPTTCRSVLPCRTLGPPRAFWEGLWPGGPCRLPPRCLWLLEAEKRNPPKGKENKEKRSKAKGWPPPRPAPPTAIAYSGVLAQRMHRYYQLEDVSEGENLFEKKKNREKKGLFRPRRSHAGGEGGAAAPAAPGPPGAPGMQRLPRTDIGSSNT